MKVTPERLKNYIELHLAVILFGLAGLFGKLLDLHIVTIVFGRTLFGSLALLVFIFIEDRSIRIENRRDFFLFVLLGIILAGHWLSFFYAIRISTVAIGLLTYASFPIFVTLLEPLVSGKAIKRREWFAIILLVLGLILIVPQFSFRNRIFLGVLFGLLSGISFAVLTLINKGLRSRYSAINITFFQDLLACLLLMPIALIYREPISHFEWTILGFLGVLCTALAHSLFIGSMKTIRAYTAGVVAALEPVYGIILAVVILSEVPTLRIIWGGMLILGVSIYVTAARD